MSLVRSLIAVAPCLALLSCGQGLEGVDEEGNLVEVGALEANETAFGFGQNTTGGCRGPECVCEVTNLLDTGPGSLRACVENDDSRYVTFTGAGRGTIQLKSSLDVGSNKTIDGRGAGRVTVTGNQIHLMNIRDSQNVIITDLAFKVNLSPACQNPADPNVTFDCGGGLMITGRAKHVWINQSQFDTCGGKCIAVWTREPDLSGDPFNFGDCNDVAEGGDLITISRNVFKNSYYGVLIGANHHLANCQIPTMRATVYRNVFRNVDRRSPRASELARVHVLNNVVTDWGANVCDDSKDEAFGASVMSGAQMLLENNFFQARANAASCKAATHIDGGFMKAIGNVARNGAVVRSNQPSRVFSPRTIGAGYDYSAATMTAGLRERVESEAGPRP